jgi:hypothetical protein
LSQFLGITTGLEPLLVAWNSEQKHVKNIFSNFVEGNVDNFLTSLRQGIFSLDFLCRSFRAKDDLTNNSTENGG